MRPTKPCRYCGSTLHYPSGCLRRPRKSAKPITRSTPPPRQTTPIRQRGKAADKWEATRREWFKQNPASSYTCYICDRFMLRSETTLDHVKPRGSRRSLRYELSNLQPCCGSCNGEKGSRNLESYIALRVARGLHVSAVALELTT